MIRAIDDFLIDRVMQPVADFGARWFGVSCYRMALWCAYIFLFEEIFGFFTRPMAAHSLRDPHQSSLGWTVFVVFTYLVCTAIMFRWLYREATKLERTYQARPDRLPSIRVSGFIGRLLVSTVWTAIGIRCFVRDVVNADSWLGLCLVAGLDLLWFLSIFAHQYLCACTPRPPRRRTAKAPWFSILAPFGA